MGQDGSVVSREGGVRPGAGNPAEGVARAFPGGSPVRGKGRCSLETGNKGGAGNFTKRTLGHTETTFLG